MLNRFRIGVVGAMLTVLCYLEPGLESAGGAVLDAEESHGAVAETGADEAIEAGDGSVDVSGDENGSEGPESQDPPDSESTSRPADGDTD